MASTIITLYLLAISALSYTCNGARSMPAVTTNLENRGGLESECWTALANMRSCSNEIIGFFLNGQSDINKPCCLSLVTIARDCWPTALLGFTLEELDLLQVYCYKAHALTPTPSPSPSPSQLYHL